MEQPIETSDVPDNQKVDKIALIGPGLDVFDCLGHKVGKVDSLSAGATEPVPQERVVVPAPVSTTGQQVAPVMLPVAPQPSSGHVPEFDTVLPTGDDLPHELQQRLAHDGFIRIDAGLLKRHRYALRDQIERVEGDRVILNVAADELLKH